MIRAISERSVLWFAVAFSCASVAVGAGCDEKSGDDEASASAESEERAAESAQEANEEETAEPVSHDPPAAEGATAFDVYAISGGFGLTWLEPVGEDGGESEGDESADTSYAFKRAEWDGESWSEPQTIVEGSEFFANWADVPSVVKTGDESYLAHWLKKKEGGSMAYDIELLRSTDGGSSWEQLGAPYGDESPTQHGFVSMVTGESGTLAVWLDGRETGANHDEGPMTLRATTVSPNEGEDREGEGSVVLDERVCDCCPTDAVAFGDSAFIAYRNRTEDEVRDIWGVRQVGGEWAEPEAVAEDGWEIDGCPVDGPAVAAEGSTVAVAWYTKADGERRVQVAFSDDGGNDFGEPIRVDVDSGEPIGRVDLAFAEGDAVVSWIASGGEGEEPVTMQMRRVAPDGELGESVTVGETSGERKGGIPRIVRSGDRVAAVWRGSGEAAALRAKSFPGAAIPAPGAGSAAKGGGDSSGSADSIPSLKASTLEEPEVNLEDRDGPLLVNLWATWCAPCRAEMPLLQKVNDRWSSEEFTMIGLSVEGEKSRDKIEEFVANNEVPFEVWFAPERDPLVTFGAGAVPATYVYNPEGELVWSHDGAIEEEELGELQEKVASLVEK